ncbi:MAG: hypothetical protein U0R76_05685 [Candidatus Nanopelagicales bacterium]
MPSTPRRPPRTRRTPTVPVAAAAAVMADAIADRAITDAAGTREAGSSSTRNDDPLLPPNTSWTRIRGIAALLLRLARVLDDGLGAPVVVAADR